MATHSEAQIKRFADPAERKKTSAATRKGMTAAVRTQLSLKKKADPRPTQRATIHGHAVRRTPTYATWSSMRNRCNNPRAANYRWYGARGIAVCARWDSFENFLADMGERPDGMTLSRHDHDGNYEPDNCCWAEIGTH